MKKMFAPLIALLPLLYIAIIGIFLVIGPSDSVLFFFMCAYLLLTVLFTICFYCRLGKYRPKELAVYSLLFSAGNLLLLLVEVIYWIIKEAEIQQQAQTGATEGSLLLLVLLFLCLPHWSSYCIVRIAGMLCCNRSLDDMCSGGTKLAHTMLHFFPVADLISSIWVLIKVNSQQKAHQIP